MADIIGAIILSCAALALFIVGYRWHRRLDREDQHERDMLEQSRTAQYEVMTNVFKRRLQLRQFLPENPPYK